MINREEGNAQIAIFMGAKLKQIKIAPDDYYTVAEFFSETVCVRNLRYHDSWDWLIPVVEEMIKTYDMESGCLRVSMEAYGGEDNPGVYCEIMDELLPKRAIRSHRSLALKQNNFNKLMLTNMWKVVVKYVEESNKRKEKMSQ